MYEVILPKTGMYEGDVTLISWLVEDRSKVRAGDPIFLMESEKVEMEIEAEVDGWMLQKADPGTEAPIGTRIGFICESESELVQCLEG